MIRFIFLTAVALAIATSAQALSPPPLHQPDGIRQTLAIAALHVVTATA